jgi:hypothetical protein
MKCVDCENFILQASVTDADAANIKKMARMGFGRCKEQPKVAFYYSQSFERLCSDFQRADAVKAQKRVEFFIQQDKKFTETMQKQMEREKC